MKKLKNCLTFVALIFVGLINSFASQTAPLFSVELKSYEALTADAAKIATALGEDTSVLEMQLQGMLGPQIFELIDPSEPWHVAVWLDSVEQPPLVAIVLPIADFEAFEVAAQSSMIGAFGVQYLDAGERVILFGSSPGAPVAEGSAEKVQGYVENLMLNPVETLQLRLVLNDAIRQTIDAAIEIPKAEIMTVFDDPAFEASGVPPEAMEGIMAGYFSAFETLLGDLESLEYGLGVSDTDLNFSLKLDLLENSESAKFLASQNVDISDLSASVSWDSDVTLLMGMAAFPEAWQSKIEQLMESLMPLYGLSNDSAAEWTEAMNMTLPFRNVYAMDLEGGMVFSGFYDILGSPVSEVYEKWLEIIESAAGEEGSIESYYSDITIKRDYRSESGHPVDLLELTINPEHPSMQLPEQKEIMEQMFKDGKINYEICLVNNRIYTATEGHLADAMAEITTTPPLEITADTRLAGSVDLISFVKLGANLSGEEMDMDLSTLDSNDTQLLFKVDTGENLIVRSSVPLKLIDALNNLE